MSWKRYKMGDFLNVRKDRFKPSEVKAKGLKRVDKIEFSGTIYTSDKETNTDMILVKKGDLLISGINAEKGAIAVYEGNEDILATIHYSSYEFDKTKINIDYLKWFLKSQAFKNLLKKSANGGIKTELKPKHILPLEINLPSVKTQEVLVKKISSKIGSVNTISTELQHQSELIKKLRQSILQDAVQGKLITEKQKIKSGESAHELLKKIKAEKQKLIEQGKLKKEKELPPINPSEIPFELPQNWAWCRLGDVGVLKRGKSKHRPRNDNKLYQNGKYPLIQTGEVSRAKYNNGLIKDINSYYNDFGLAQSELQKVGTLCITIAANIAEYGFLQFEACVPDSIVCFNSIDNFILKYVSYFINISKDDLERYAPSTAQKNINLGILTELMFPLPPLSEQERIVAKVEELIKTCNELEKEVEQSKTHLQQVMQSVLREAFEAK